MSPWPPEGEPSGKGEKPVTLPRPGHADLAGLLGVLHGLPLAYNKDLQEDKAYLFDAMDTVDLLVPAMTGMIATADFRRRARRRNDEAHASNSRRLVRPCRRCAHDHHRRPADAADGDPRPW